MDGEEECVDTLNMLSPGLNETFGVSHPQAGGLSGWELCDSP